MGKFIKRICITLLLVIIPLSFVITFAFIIRASLNKQLIYGYKNNYKQEYKLKQKTFGESSVVYAKVKNNCYFFKTSDITDTTHNNVFFIIPETYFVIVLDNINLSIIKVQYKNKIGYVSADSIKVVSFTPIVPFLEGITFDITSSSGTQIRLTPNVNNSSNILHVIPAGTKNVNYIAKTIGNIPTGGSSNIWYYVLYTPISDPTSVYEGYVYSEKAINISKINPNEEDEIVPSEDNDNRAPEIYINGSVKTILIVIICIPIVLVFVLLVIQNKRTKNNKSIKDVLINNSDNEDTGSSNNANKITKSIDKKTTKKLKEFEGKTFSKKNPYFAKFISSEQNKDNSFASFPSYEVVDDDDLL